MELEVTRDGEIDQSYARQQRVQAIQSSFTNLSHMMLTGLRTAASELITPVVLDVVDARNHSNLREQYFVRKRAGELAAIANKFDLV